MLDPIDLILVGLAAVAAGAINALAGGGTLITFPMLTAVGVPAIAANVTNTIALCPGYIGGTLAQARDLRGQASRLWLTLPAGVIGGLSAASFCCAPARSSSVIWCPSSILLASLLLAIQDPVRGWLSRRLGQGGSGAQLEKWSWLPVGLAAVYGGYFGAGLSVIVLAALGVTLEDNLTRLNALKQLIGFATNMSRPRSSSSSPGRSLAAAVCMAVGALLGGTLGGQARRPREPATLRWIVVSIGVSCLGYLLCPRFDFRVCRPRRH